MSESDIPEKLGRYEIVRELGKGAMGVVYEGRDPNIGRRVALKTARRDVLAASGMASEMMERFLREARAAGALNHPNIITIYDTDEEDGTAWIAMEFIEGSDLREMLLERRGLDLGRILEMGAQICDALEVAHRQGIVHRDIKPANILITREGSLKVADFGIAHVTDSTLTQEGALIGTPHYMSPEQFMGQNIDGRADLFSVGIILYELLTGEKPFSGEALSTVMHHVIKTMPVVPSELNLSIPQHVDTVLLKAMAKRPQERYASASAMAAALRECKKDNPDPAVLGIDSASAGATVVSSGADATIAGPPVAPAGQNANEATLPSGTAPVSQNEATMPSQSAPGVAGDATMPSQSAPGPAGDATIPSQVSPAMGSAAAPDTAPASDNTTESKSKAMKQAAVIVTVIAIVIVGLWWVLAGAGARGPEAPGPDNVAPVADVVEDSYNRVTVLVKRDVDQDVAVNLVPTKSVIADAAAFLDIDEVFYVEIVDAASGDVISERKKLVGGKATINFDRGVKVPQFVLYRGENDQEPIKSGSETLEDDPTEPNMAYPAVAFIINGEV